jgi:hypothetical protein
MPKEKMKDRKTWEDGAEFKKSKERHGKWRDKRLMKKARVERPEDNEDVKRCKAAESSGNFDIRKFSTLSIAVPGSILENAQSQELRTYVAGQIARAASIYKVDEIIVYDDKGEITESEKKTLKVNDDLGEARPGCLQLARILQYLECPQYLRKYFFPIHKDLQYAGLLNPLDTPHHLRQQDVSLFREGVVSNKPLKTGKGSLVSTCIRTNFSLSLDLVDHRLIY